ncbi:MAG TPA: AMP-binding protein [Acidimicrobiales bacterium]|nr:AMP-binding protein [Acidimicrobiales bacterium]
MVSDCDTDDLDLLDSSLRRNFDQPDAEYLIDARSARVIRYGDLAPALAQRRAQFDAWGLRPGDRVGLLFVEPISFVQWFLAGLHAGLWVAPLDPTAAASSSQVIDHRAHALSLAVVISDHAEPREGSTRWLVATNTLREGGPLSAEAPGGGVLLASSGTTGAPKVMALSKKQLLTNARLIAENHEFTRSDRGFNPLPLWHINAEVVGVLASLYAGSALVLDDRFHRTGFWKVVDDLQATWINAVPAIISHLAALQEGERAAPRLRFVRSASAPLSPLLMREFELTTGVDVIESYGMTEAGSQICANPLGEARKSGSVGRPVGVEVCVVSSLKGRETELAAGEIGLVKIKGPTVITSYESAEYADRFDAEGWLRTGDLGYFDADGFLFLVGRSDDVINRGGEKIYPQEIENVLGTVENLQRVVVVGEPDDVFGQLPVAYLEAAPSVTQDLAQLRDFLDSVRHVLNDRLTKAYRPATLKVVTSIPTHATGKVRKALVRDGEVTVVLAEPL